MWPVDPGIPSMTSGGSLRGKLFVALTQMVPPLAPALWRWWYNTLARKDDAGELLFMNYGYADDSAPLTLAPADEPYRYPLQLYRQVVSGLDLAGRDVLEVGSGRGYRGERYHHICEGLEHLDGSLGVFAIARRQSLHEGIHEHQRIHFL